MKDILYTIVGVLVTLLAGITLGILLIDLPSLTIYLISTIGLVVIILTSFALGIAHSEKKKK